MSFADLANGKRAQTIEGGAAYSAMIFDRSNPGGVTSVVLGRWKLIEMPTGMELYDVRSDPGEHSNRLRTKPPILDTLLKTLQAHQAAAKQSPFK